MATVKNGILSKSPEWWKHLRWAKRKFWKKERANGKKLAAQEVERGGGREV
jgi:hypothetical protein